MLKGFTVIALALTRPGDREGELPSGAHGGDPNNGAEPNWSTLIHPGEKERLAAVSDATGNRAPPYDGPKGLVAPSDRPVAFSTTT